MELYAVASLMDMLPSCDTVSLAGDDRAPGSWAPGTKAAAEWDFYSFLAAPVDRAGWRLGEARRACDGNVAIILFDENEKERGGK